MLVDNSTPAVSPSAGERFTPVDDTPGIALRACQRNRTRDTLITLDPVHVGSSLAWRQLCARPPHPGSLVKSQDDKQTCALRALTLCDGQVLELPDRGLEVCLCEAIAAADRRLAPAVAAARREERQRLIERTMVAPQLPLSADC